MMLNWFINLFRRKTFVVDFETRHSMDWDATPIMTFQDADKNLHTFDFNIIPVYDENGNPEDPIITELVNEAWNKGYAERVIKK